MCTTSNTMLFGGGDKKNPTSFYICVWRDINTVSFSLAHTVCLTSKHHRVPIIMELAFIAVLWRSKERLSTIAHKPSRRKSVAAFAWAVLVNYYKMTFYLFIYLFSPSNRKPERRAAAHDSLLAPHCSGGWKDWRWIKPDSRIVSTDHVQCCFISLLSLTACVCFCFSSGKKKRSFTWKERTPSKD